MALLNYSLRIIGFLFYLTIQKLNGCSVQVVVFLSVPKSAHLDLVPSLETSLAGAILLGSWRKSIKTFRPLLEPSPCCPAGHWGSIRSSRDNLLHLDWSHLARSSYQDFVSRGSGYNEIWLSTMIPSFLTFLSIDCLKYWCCVMNEPNGWMMWKQF